MRLIFLLQEDAMQSKNDLPIQRCIKGEPLEALSDVELLAVLIGSGVKGKNVMECAFYVIEQFGGMNGIYRAGTYRWCWVCESNTYKSCIRVREEVNSAKKL